VSVANPLSLERERMARTARTMSIAHEYAAGEPLYKIMRRYNVAAGTICNIARKFGILKRNGCMSDVRERVGEMYRAGSKLADIVKETGVDRKTIWVIAREAGLPLRRAPNGQGQRHAKTAAAKGVGQYPTDGHLADSASQGNRTNGPRPHRGTKEKGARKRTRDEIASARSR